MNDTPPANGDQPTVPIYPPPASGFADQPNDRPQFGEPPVGAAAATVDWHAKYQHQRKRSQIFMATTVAAIALLIASLFYAGAQASNNENANNVRDDAPGMGRYADPGIPEGEGPEWAPDSGPGVPGGGMNSDRFRGGMPMAPDAGNESDGDQS